MDGGPHILAVSHSRVVTYDRCTKWAGFVRAIQFTIYNDIKAEGTCDCIEIYIKNTHVE
jgi:hypothetical protein